MREIKFRVWHKQMNRMLSNDWLISACVFYDKMIDNKEIYLMQFTGLKDKNGKEIYEGDFIYYDLAEGLGLPKQTGLKREVKYSPYGFFGQYDVNIIVVGNVHENPELLNQ